MITADNWLKARLQYLHKNNFNELTPSEKEALKTAAKKAGRKEQQKAILIGTTAAAVAVVAIPILLVLGLIVNSALLILSPDAAFYPILAAMVGSSGFLGWKAFQALSQFYIDSVFSRWNQGLEIQNLSQNL